MDNWVLIMCWSIRMAALFSLISRASCTVRCSLPRS